MTKDWLAAGIVGLMLSPFICGADPKTDYAELSRLIQQAVVDKAPKRFDDRSDWGWTTPTPVNVRFPNMQRTVVRVNGRDEFPHGVWNRSLIWLDDPAKDIEIRVLDVKPLDANNYRVKLEATVAFHGERERRRWRNGVQLFGLTVQADARIAAELECAVKISLDASKFPPDLIVEPKVLESRLELKEFDLNRVGNLLEGDPALALGDELRGLIQDLLRQREGEVKEYANQALARALKDGTAKIPATELLKKMPAKAEKK